MGNSRLNLFLIIAGCAAVYLFVLSDSGLLERARLRRQREALAQRIGRAEERHNELQRLIERYRRGELMGEEAHRAGFLAPGEKMVFAPGAGDSQQDPRKVSQEKAERASMIGAARIIWLVASGILVLFYFTRRVRPLERQ